jgi:hypothetical protein
MRSLPLLASLVLLVPLAACGGAPSDDGTDKPDRDTDPDRPTADVDGDGYAIVDGDCNDADADVHPGATDAPYDGVDADCSGGSDNDADGDGFDDASRGGDDCDDADAARYPGAAESYEDEVDSDCDGYADVGAAACASSFTLTFPDGSTSTVDGCAAFSMEAGYEFDPDEAPAMVSLALRFNAWSDEAFECTVSLDLGAVCEPGYYLIPDATIGWATFDCTGAPNDAEASYTGFEGWVALDSIDTGSTPGNFSGRPLYASVMGSVWAESREGVTLEGIFDVGAEQIATDADVVPECAVVDGDVDGDGYVTTALRGGDCDDTDASVNPGVVVDDCSGVDEDCDGDVDEDGTPVSWYVDRDGDGYGDGGELVICTPPEGYSRTDDDCDDTRPGVNPGATEVVGDTRDQDCDGVDSCYVDVDGDRYGDTIADSADLDCTDLGESRTGGDCDDASRVIYPGAVETPVDGVDNDCDGAEACYVDSDGDGYGSASTVDSTDLDCVDGGESDSAEDCDDADVYTTPDDLDGDGYAGCDGDCDDTDASVTPDDGCGYTSMTGTFRIPAYGIAWDTYGTGVDPSTVCPSCEFMFDGMLDGYESYEVYYAFDWDSGDLSFLLNHDTELGPFPGTVTAGASYDILEWSGPARYSGYTYEGTFYMY